MLANTLGLLAGDAGAIAGANAGATPLLLVLLIEFTTISMARLLNVMQYHYRT